MTAMLRALLQRHGAWAGLVLAGVLALPPLRDLLESSMRLHMLVQAPLLALSGWWLAAALPPRTRSMLARWNAYGIAGLVLFAAASGLLMIPRLLDLVLVDGRLEAAKFAMLLAAGAALRLSWRQAGWVVQGFFLGNVLPMTAVAGQLYQDSPLRLCNAYRLGDQVALGATLVGISLAVAVGWGGWLFVALARREGRSLPAA